MSHHKSGARAERPTAVAAAQERQRNVPANGYDKSKHERNRGVRAQRGEMQHRERGSEAEQSLQPGDEHGRSEGAAASRLQDQDQARKYDRVGGKQARHLGAECAACKRSRNHECCNEQSA